jgi:class 3 adenylate cyclase
MIARSISFRSRLILYFVGTIFLLTACFYSLVLYFAEKSLDHQLQRTRQSVDKLLQAEVQRREQILRQYVEGLERNVRFKAALEELNVGGDVELLRQTLISNYRPKQFAFPPTLLAIADGSGKLQVRFLPSESYSSNHLRGLSGARLYEVLEENTRIVENEEAAEAVLTTKAIAQSGDSSLTAYIQVKERGLFMVVSQKLVFDGGETLGAVVMGSSLDDAFLSSFDKTLNETDMVELLLQGGGDKTSNSGIAGLLTESEAALPERIQRDGKTYGILTVPLTPAYTGAILTDEVPRLVFALDFTAQVNAQQELLRVTLFIGLIGVILSAVLCLFLARVLAKPILELVAGTRRLVRGEYPVEVAVRTEDEFGTLAESFNELSKGLELKDRYRSLMDMVVSPEIADQIRSQEEAGTLNLGGDRQRVTILFADIREFTPLSQQLEPEEILELLNEFFETASAVIEEFGGVIDKYIGDEIMSLFGAPLARGDDAKRALQAAIALRDAVKKLNHKRESNGKAALSVGIGLASGEVVAGLIGSKKRLSYSVIGPAVNLAARLCGAAGGLEILVSDEIVAENIDVDFEKKEDVYLKGISENVAVHRVGRTL